MKKIFLIFGFGILITSGVFAQDMSVLGNIISQYPLITAIVIIAHICLTFAVYKMKGGPWDCFYFFLAPVVVLLLLLLLFGNAGEVKSNRKDIYHHYR